MVCASRACSACALCWRLLATTAQTASCHRMPPPLRLPPFAVTTCVCAPTCRPAPTGRYPQQRARGKTAARPARMQEGGEEGMGAPSPGHRGRVWTQASGTCHHQACCGWAGQDGGGLSHRYPADPPTYPHTRTQAHTQETHTAHRQHRYTSTHTQTHTHTHAQAQAEAHWHTLRDTHRQRHARTGTHRHADTHASSSPLSLHLPTSTHPPSLVPGHPGTGCTRPPAAQPPGAVAVPPSA